MPTPNAKTAPPAEAAAAQSTTPESLGWQLRAALPSMRLHSITLCDHEGDVLWLSEGALGPDEHGYVLEAISVLTSDASLAHCESDLQDGRYGVFLAVRAPQGDLVGLAMILADSKGLGNGIATRILSQQTRLVLQKIAIHLRPHSAAPVAATPAPKQGNATAQSAASDTLEIAPPAIAAPAPTPAPAARPASPAAAAPASTPAPSTRPAPPAAAAPASAPAARPTPPSTPNASNAGTRANASGTAHSSGMVGQAAYIAANQVNVPPAGSAHAAHVAAGLNTRGGGLNAPATGFTGAPAGVSIPTAAPVVPTKATPTPQRPQQPSAPPADIGSTTSILSPLAVDEILSFELIDDDSPLPAPQEDPALALSPNSSAIDDVVELALEEEPVVLAVRAPDTSDATADAPSGLSLIDDEPQAKTSAPKNTPPTLTPAAHTAYASPAGTLSPPAVPPAAAPAASAPTAKAASKGLPATLGAPNLPPPTIEAAAGTPSAFVQRALSALANASATPSSKPSANVPPVDVPVLNAAPSAAQAVSAPVASQPAHQEPAHRDSVRKDAPRADAIPTLHDEHEFSGPALSNAQSAGAAATGDSLGATSRLASLAPSSARSPGGSAILAAMSAAQAVASGQMSAPQARGVATPNSSASASATGSRRVETSLRPSPLTDPAFKDLALSVQLLNKLRPGGRTKRYEVLVRNKQNPTALDAAREILRSMDENADIDGFVLCQLLTWLVEHPQASEREPLTFSINLSHRALNDERFPDFIAFWLRKTGVAAESIGFELNESICVQHKAAAERFVTACEKLGCFLVLDDFTMDTRALDFLRSKSLKLIKLESRLTNDAMKDKLCQALVIAISQAAKVLGVHCAAKKIESQMVRRWVTAIGFDFAQGTLFEGPQHVDGLLAPSPPAKPE